jgi:small-conductance mechanosensitive channel/CRP-like cAMP-binding protein
MSQSLRKLWSPLVLFSVIIFSVFQVETLLSVLNLPQNWYDISFKIFSTLAWVVAALVIIRIVRVLVWEGIVQHSIQRTPPRLIMQLGNVAILFLAGSGIATFVFDQSITAFWTASGALGIVVGFALQNLILDTFSGLAIHLERPFKVGDWINCHTRMGNYIGRVEETNWRTTRLWTTSRNIVIIPNSFMTTTVVTNFSMPGAEARFELEFTLDFAISTERAVRVLTAAAHQAIGPKGPLADPAPKVRVNGVGDYGIVYNMRYYLDPDITSPSKARNTIITCVTKHLSHAGISLSYPKRDVFTAPMPWRQKSWTHNKDQVSQMGKLSLFEVLHQDDIEFIAEKMLVRHFKARETVVTQGDEGDSMFILAEGLLEVLVENKEKELLKVADLAPGTFFGEKSLLTGDPRSATIICATDVVACEITKSAMSELFGRNMDVAPLLSKAVALRDLANLSALSRSSEGDHEENLTKQTDLFLGKLKSFFGLKTK